MIGWIILDSYIENVKVISKTFEFDWSAVWGWKGKCPPKYRLRLQNQFFFTLEKAVPEGREKARNPGDKEACVNSHRRLQNQFFFLLWRKLFQRVEKRLVILVTKKHVWTFTEGCEIFFFLFLIYNFGDRCTRESRNGYSSQSQRSMCVCNI